MELFHRGALDIHPRHMATKLLCQLYNDNNHSILPALAFSLDMFTKTESSYGVNEVLLASVLGSVVFSICACQPITIVGVTGNSTSISSKINHRH